MQVTFNVTPLQNFDFKRKQAHQVVTYYALSFTHPPSPEFASELQWPVHTNLDTFTLNTKHAVRWAGVSTLVSLEIWQCNMAANWEQDPYSMYILVYI